MPELIYLASPYSHEDPIVKERRFNEVCRVAAMLMKEGRFVYSPIAHTHPIAQFGLPSNWDYWEKFDTLMLSKCDKLFVVQMDGWIESKGVQAEIKIAEKIGIPIEYIIPVDVAFRVGGLAGSKGVLETTVQYPIPVFGETNDD